MDSESKVSIQKKVRKKRVMSEKTKFPVIPIRGLWDQASVEDQSKAREISQVMMEYWIGRLSKKEATEKLGMRPVRFWQMSQQAVAGMTAGLLTQPRYRNNSFLPSDETAKLGKKIEELELILSTQQKLIEILKSLPGQKRNQAKVTVNDGKPTRKSRMPGGTKNSRGTELDTSSSRKSEDIVAASGRDAANTERLEAEREARLSPA
jgi:hypothetical protein